MILLIAGIKLLFYVIDLGKTFIGSLILRNEYHESIPTTPAPSLPPTAAPRITPAPTSVPSPTPIPTPDPLADLVTLAPRPYPGNPYKKISTRFSKLQRRNKDIVGWLNIPEMLDEAVVMRDNKYYLRRDYLGYHNDNGALFLDQSTTLSTRPSAYVIYGHNMKTGAMFGCLRQYENVSFYKNCAFLTFDTQYEEGKYVVFAVADVCIERGRPDYAGFQLMQYATIRDRAACVTKIKQLSIIKSPVDVVPEDQFLFLVTCEGDDSYRRVVAARRLRYDGEEGELQKQIDGMRNKR